MKLGDAVESATNAIHIKPCAKCKQRKDLLNAISRRGFVGGALFAAFLAKNAVLKTAWTAFGADIPLDLDSVLGFIRTANTTQRHNYHEHGTHLDKQGMLIGVASHREHFNPTHPGYLWMSKFSPAATQILPGWTLDFAKVAPGHSDGTLDFKDGYIFALRGERITFIADELGNILYARTPATAPDLSALPDAYSFPGAGHLTILAANKSTT
jgi:hypothetical protein